jgi:SPP1 family holin
MKTPAVKSVPNVKRTLIEEETQMNEVKRIDTIAIIRMVLLAVALINQSLVLAGYSPLPFEDAQIEAFLSGAFTAVMAVWSWWKNNDITREARRNAVK